MISILNEGINCGIQYKRLSDAAVSVANQKWLVCVSIFMGGDTSVQRLSWNVHHMCLMCIYAYAESAMLVYIRLHARSRFDSVLFASHSSLLFFFISRKMEAKYKEKKRSRKRRVEKSRDIHKQNYYNRHKNKSNNSQITVQPIHIIRIIYYSSAAVRKPCQLWTFRPKSLSWVLILITVECRSLFDCNWEEWNVFMMSCNPFLSHLNSSCTHSWQNVCGGIPNRLVRYQSVDCMCALLARNANSMCVNVWISYYNFFSVAHATQRSIGPCVCVCASILFVFIGLGIFDSFSLCLIQLLQKRSFSFLFSISWNIRNLLS